MRLKSGLATGIDQAWLSLLNLAVSFAFIRFSTKEEYGVYLLLLTPIYLIQGLQNALLLSPLNTVLPAAAEDERDAVVGTAVSAMTTLAVTSGVVGGLLLLLYFFIETKTLLWQLAVAFCLAIAGLSAREGARSVFYAQGRPSLALRSDLVYGAGVLVVLGCLLLTDRLTAKSALLGIGFAALWPYFSKIRVIHQIAIDRSILSRLWECGRWALVGVVVTWINLSAYPLIVGFYLSSTAVADINAARLFMMPFAVGIAGWSSLVRPRISMWMARGQKTHIQNVSLRSMAIGLFTLGCFVVIVYLGYPRIEQLLGPEYGGLLALVILWAIYFSISLVRTVFMASLMTDEAGYKQLQKFSWYALIFSLTGLWLLTPFGTKWVVGVLIFVELLQLFLIGMAAIARWRVV